MGVVREKSRQAGRQAGIQYLRIYLLNRAK